MRNEIQTENLKATLSKGFTGVFFYTVVNKKQNKSFALLGIDGTVCINQVIGARDEAECIERQCLSEFENSYTEKEILVMLEDKYGPEWVQEQKPALTSMDKWQLLNIAFRNVLVA